MNNFVSKFGPGDKVKKKDGTVGIVERFYVVEVIYKLKNDDHAYYDYQLKAVI